MHITSHRNGWLPMSDAYGISFTSHRNGWPLDLGGFDTPKNQCLMPTASAVYNFRNLSKEKPAAAGLCANRFGVGEVYCRVRPQRRCRWW